MVVDVSDKSIPSGQSSKVSIKVKLHGHSGDFHDRIRIKTVSGADIPLDIKGKIVTDIWHDGQALRCTAEPEQRQVSAILTLYTKDHPAVDFAKGKQEENIAVSEIERHTQNGETSIRFLIEVEIGELAFLMRRVHFVPTDPEISPLSIPLYCYRGE